MSNSLDNLSSYYLPNTLDGINVISDEVSTNALLVDGSNYMIADLNMNNHNIKNLDPGINGTDAVNLTQLLNVSASSTLYAASVSSASYLFTSTQSALKVNKAGDVMLGNLEINTANPILNIMATNENQNASLYLATPYQNISNLNKTAIIAQGINSYSRSNLHFCVNNTTNSVNASLSDSKMCIINSTGNVGIATTTPAQKLDVNGSSIIRGALDMNTTNKIINVANGTSNLDAVNLSQLNSASSSSALYTQTISNGVSSASNIYSNGVSSSSKLYIDSIDAGIRIDVATALNNVSTSSRLYSDSVSSASNIYSNSVSSSSKLYTDAIDTMIRIDATTELNKKVNKSGDTMSGPLRITETIGTSSSTAGTLTLIHNDVGGKSSIVFPSNINYGSDYGYIEYRDNTGSGENSYLTIGVENDATTSIEDRIYFKLNSANRIVISGDGKLGINNMSPTEMLDVNGSGIFNSPSSTTTINRQLSLIIENNSNNGLFFHNNLSGGSWNSLVGANDKAIIFSNGTTNSGNLVIGNWGDAGLKIVGSSGNIGIGTSTPSEKLDVIGRCVLSKTASNLITQYTYTDWRTYDMTVTSNVYDYLTMTFNVANLIYVPTVESGNTSLLNKVVNIHIPNATSFTMISKITLDTIIINDISYNNFNPYSFNPGARKFQLIGTPTVGKYIIETNNWDTVPENIDQLTIKSNLGNVNTEFTGIRFLNSNTEAGLIRVETDRTHNNSVMRFYTRSSNATILPLEVNQNIVTNVPIIRNAWSSGELIQTKIYNQNNNGSGLAVFGSGQSSNWMSFSIQTKNTSPATSIITIKVDVPYYLSGSNTDYLSVTIFDTTGGIGNQIFKKVQTYEGAGGGGTRSGPIFPLICSHIPSQATGTQSRTYTISITNGSTDTLYIGYGYTTGLISLDHYTIEITEIKI